MKKNNLKRFLASLLAVLMLSQVTGVAPGVFAEDETGTTEPTEARNPSHRFLKRTQALSRFLSSRIQTLRTLLQKALLANYSELTKRANRCNRLASMSAKDI